MDFVGSIHDRAPPPPPAYPGKRKSRSTQIKKENTDRSRLDQDEVQTENERTGT